jgi:hypothetical protein
MRKALFVLLVPIYMLLVANVGCHSGHLSKEPVEVYFWKNRNAQTAHQLYIDDSLRAELPYVPDSLAKKGDNTSKKQGVLVNLVPGRYDVMAKDANNNVLCEGELTIRIREGSNKISTSFNNSYCSIHVALE